MTGRPDDTPGDAAGCWLALALAALLALAFSQCGRHGGRAESVVWLDDLGTACVFLLASVSLVRAMVMWFLGREGEE